MGYEFRTEKYYLTAHLVMQKSTSSVRYYDLFVPQEETRQCDVCHAMSLHLVRPPARPATFCIYV